MARRIAAIVRALTANWSPALNDVHFHGGATGPYVCEDPRCTSPHLSLESR
jgi:hypothetical protein